MPSALILIANGTEEMEFTIVYDTLVRAGIECTSAFVPSASEVGLSSAGGWGVSDVLVTCSRGVKITADTTLDGSQAQGKTYDVVVVPGGAKGADTLSQSEAVQRLVKAQYDGAKLIGMICAGSLVAKMSKLPKQPLTSHPSVKAYLDSAFEYKEESVVVSGKLITSRGPGEGGSGSHGIPSDKYLIVAMKDVISSSVQIALLSIDAKMVLGGAPGKMLALTLLRQTTCKRNLPSLISASQKTTPYISQPQTHTRSYAKRRQALDEDADTDFVYHKGKKGKQGKDMKHVDEVILDKNNITDPSLRFVPSSSMPHGAAYDAEEKSADEKMAASVRWLKETARGVEVRSSGRVVPDVLDAVRVPIRLDEEGENDEEMEVGLKEVASVGVKNGNVLVVTVFEEQTIKAVEKALYAAKLPGLTPQRSDARTILMPVSQPTVESRNALVAALQKQAEETKIAIRKVHQASQKKVKALGFDAKSAAMTDLTALVNRRLEEIDKLVEQTKKAVSK